MKISYNWLRQYIETDLNPSEIAEILTSIGLEVEAMEEWSSVEGGLEGIVIGEVLEAKPHPDADRLTLTRVDVGGPEPLSIVCGAPNVAAGQKVAVATVGTTLHFNDSDIVIKRSKIRGEVSEGMICAEDELGMGTDHEGIMVLDASAIPGTAGADYFTVEKDTIFEIGLTPNRIDGASHYGVARDLAAYLNKTSQLAAKLPDVETFRSDNNDFVIPVIVENSIDCPRYTGLTISGIKVEESPQWLKNRLRAIDLTPINNVVDITNYVLHEAGQPLHAFDADKIDGGRVIVKNLPDKSRFTSLDEMDRELSDKDLMICDSNGGMCIGGVFGGIDSGVTESTTRVFLESAYFNPVSIRKSARRHDLHTDASFRFERGVDPSNTLWALKRAALMIKEIAGGKITSDIIDIYPKQIPDRQVKVKISNIERLIGNSIPLEDVKSILSSLEIKLLSEDDKFLLLSIPSYRVDVTREADVIEEILRIYGYNSVLIDEKVNSTLTYIEKPDREKVINGISDMLTGAGFTEIMSNSLTQSTLYEDNADFPASRLVMLANPLSSDLNAMRQTLLYGGLSAIERNINRQQSDLRFYEFGNCYFRDKSEAKYASDFSEQRRFDIFISGSRTVESWDTREEPSGFFTIKSTINMVLARLGADISGLDETYSSLELFSEGLDYVNDKHTVASLGKIRKDITRSFGIKQDVYYGTIDWASALEIVRKRVVGFNELPKFPAVRRDLALLLDKSVSFSDLQRLAFSTEKILLREVGLFDVYEDKSLGDNKKSYALSFILRDDRRTLTDKMIDKVMKNLIRVYETELNATVR